ncbi:MAG TPA: PKD domain-containing protein [Candidatus Kapabacteria bacterium]|nr:PKD domain-containing protein [Candidatus Kapabacteria bacterium]
MKTAISLILVGASLSLVSCKSDVTNVVSSNAISLAIKPDSLFGVPYQTYSLEARVNGMAQSDIYYTWDFGDSLKSSNGSYTQQHSYAKTGTYPIVVTAFDQFTDTIIAKKQTSAVIHDTLHSITVFPRTGDSAVVVDENGMFTQTLFSYNIKYSSPAPSLYVTYHIIIDGKDSVIKPLYASDGIVVFLNYPKTVKVVVTAVDGSGVSFGKDSSVINYKARPLDAAFLRSMTYVSVHLALDALSIPQFTTPPRSLKIGLPLTDTLPGSNWNGLSFANENNATHQNFYPNFPSVDDAISGSLSGDLTAIPSVAVSVNDTALINGATYPLQWSYTLNNLTLYHITANSVVYAVLGKSLNQFASGVKFSSTLNPYTGVECGNPSQTSFTFPAQTALPFGYVMFSR